MSGRNQLRLADSALQRRDYEEAERLYLEALADNVANPVEAARGLALVYGGAGRHFECMLLARSALRGARAARDTRQELHCLGILCTSLANIPAMPRLGKPLSELGALLEQNDHPRAWRMHRTAAFALALHLKRFDDAEHLLKQIRDRVGSEPLGSHEERAIAFLEMRLARARGDGPLQLRLLNRIVSERRTGHPERLPLCIQRAIAQAEAGALDDARESARIALGLLHDEQDASFTSEIRASEGARLGRLFWETLGDLARAQETFDLVTAALLNRVLQLDASIAQLEAVGALGGNDESVLMEMRSDFMDAMIGMLRQVSSIQREAADDGAAARVFDEDDVDGTLRVCAWCDRVRVPGRIWLPLGQFAPRERAHRVTHGMCETCHERERATFA